METPKIKKDLKLPSLKNNSYSASPMRNVNFIPDTRFKKCSSERKLDKNRFISPISIKERHKLQRRAQKKPEVQRTLNFENIAAIGEKSPVTKKLNDSFVLNVTYLKENKVVPCIDTPKRKVILKRGTNSYNNSLSVIGYGRFGKVIKAEYKGEKVAVKVIKKYNKVNCNTLLKETNGINLNHPNVINVIKVVNNLDSDYGLVIMELWETINLQHMLNYSKSFIPLELKLRYLINISEGLRYCHNRNIIHLDIKPKNILVSPDRSNCCCKICDFGSSVLINGDDEGSKNNFDYVNHQGTVKYMAPELLRGEIASQKADVYSFGITMWQLLFEEIPYEGESLDIIAYKVVSQDYRPKVYESGNEELPVINLIKMCWQQKPEMRPVIGTVNLKLQEIQELRN